MNSFISTYGKDIVKIVFGLAVGMILFSKCNGGKDKNTQKIEVVIPEKKGEILKPVAIVNHRNKDSIEYRKGQIVYTENPINKKLAEDYIKAQKENDSLKTFKLYVDAIQEREQERIFDNKDVTVNVRTKTRGEILEQDIKYTVKEQIIKAEVPFKEDKFGFLISGQYGQDIITQKPNVGVGAGVRVKKISILATVNTDKKIGLQIIKEL